MPRISNQDALAVLANELAATIFERDQALAQAATLERRVKRLEELHPDEPTPELEEVPPA